MLTGSLLIAYFTVALLESRPKRSPDRGYFSDEEQVSLKTQLFPRSTTPSLHFSIVYHSLLCIGMTESYGSADKEGLQKSELRVSEVENVTSDDGGTTLMQTTFNGINILLGVGVLSLPFAFKQAGWILGLASEVVCVEVLVANYFNFFLRRNFSFSIFIAVDEPHWQNCWADNERIPASSGLRRNGGFSLWALGQNFHCHCILCGARSSL